jgi:hypothetical protein
MFKRQTLFILGAGSSIEVGLPPGTKLATAIGAKMDIRFEQFSTPVGSGDMDLFMQVTSRMQTDVREYQYAAWLIRDGIALAQSIDDFIDLHRANPHLVQYGKAAIVKSILEAEQKSRLYFKTSAGPEIFNPESIADTWFVKFMRLLGRGIPKENARTIFDHVSFIVFNYDRCVEHFLFHALQKLYGIRPDEASGIVDDLNINHPYGVVGDLDEIPFGNTGVNFAKLTDKIKTYTEQTADADLIAKLDTEIQRAACIIFLGFAYHDQNMRILMPNAPCRANLSTAPHTRCLMRTSR